MKKALISLATVAALSAGSASAFFGNDDDWKCYGPYGKIPDCNPYDEFDPRFWMEEMEQMFDDDDYGYGYRPYGPMPYGAPMMPYGGAPMPYNAPMPYGAPAPMAPPAPPAPAPAPVR